MSESISSTVPEQPFRLFPALREAVRGTHRDYTSGPLGPAILLLAVPMVLETVMESLFAVVDVFFVARLGSDAAAAVGLTESMLTLVYTVALGLGIGVTALVARRIGEKNPEAAAHTAVQAIILGLGIAAVVGVIGFFTAERLLVLMGAPASVIQVGLPFTRIMLTGNGVILMLFLINAIFRGAGDAAIAMRVLWLANVINIVLDPCLIFGWGPFPQLGITGAAVATTTGRGIAVVVQLVTLLNAKNARIQVRRRHLSIKPAVMWQLVRLSANGTFQIFIGMASWVGLIRVLAGFGSAPLAGYTIAVRTVMLAILPSWGMSNAAATMVGQALGAGDPERAERAVWLACFYNVWFMGAISAIFIILARPIVGVFTSDPTTAHYAVQCLRVVSAGFVFYAYGMVLTQSFNGAGDTWTPTVINLFCFWLWELPAAYAMAQWLDFGPIGVFLAIATAYSALAVVSAIVFRRGKWKERVV